MNNGCIQQPSRLYSICLNYLCNNLDLVCDLKQIDIETKPSKLNLNGLTTIKKYTNLKKYEFKDKLVKFNHIISEDLLERLCELEKLNDTSLALFTSYQTCLKKFHIKNSCLSKDVIKLVLKQHQIDELVINNILFESSNSVSSNFTNGITNANSINTNTNGSITINDLVDSLNDWSIENLKYLNVARNTSLFGSILINLNKFNSLSKLNVSYTCFNNHSLDIICQDLTSLEFLDISGTKVNDLSPLLHLKDKLKYLYMYNMRASLSDDLIKSVSNLIKLQYLDLSCDVSTKIFADMTLSLFDVNLLLDELASVMLPDLKYLDVSGKISIKQESLIRFMKAYPDLKFIGLALTNANSFDMFVKEPLNGLNHSNVTLHVSSSSPTLSNLADQTPLDKQRNNQIINKLKSSSQTESMVNNRSDLIVTGESTEFQLISSLKHYKTRHIYIQKALYHLFMLTRNYQQTRVDLIQIIIDLMQIHSKSQSVQLAATTCIFNLTRQNLYVNIPANILTQIINTIITTMLNYSNTLILQKNCLFILCNEQMLNSCTFNKLDCIKATLDCLNIYTEPNIINSSIAICAQVALNAEKKYRKQFKKLNDQKYMQKLISIVSSIIRSGSHHFEDEESILHSVLDIIWSLSEDNIEWCCNFITQNGLNIYSNLIGLFENDLDVLYKTMSLIYNLSEIPEIRPILFNHQIIENIKNLMNYPDLKLNFLSVGCFANQIAFMSGFDWDWNKFDYRGRMETVMKNWSSNTNLMIDFKYFYFDPLIRLTEKYNEPVAQIWSLWAIYFINRSQSITEVGNINLKKILEKLINDTYTLPETYNLCVYLQESIQNEKETE